jgi:hypothetical protein
VQSGRTGESGDDRNLLHGLLQDCMLVLIPVLTLFGFVLSRPQVLADGDTGWHVAAGTWIITHRGVPTTDIFSYSAVGTPWTAHEWLADVLMGAAYAAIGWSGVLILYGLVLAGLGAALALYLRRWLDANFAAVLVTWIIAGLMPFILARPHVMAWLPLAAWAVILLRAREQDRAPPLWSALVITIWANLHGSFIFGLLLIGPFAAEALIAAPAENRWKVLRDWTIFFAASLLAALITPFGLHGLLFPLQLMAMPSLAAVAEWKATDFSSIGLFEVLLLTGLGSCLWLGVRIPVWRLAIVIGLLHMAFSHVRHQAVFVIVSGLIIAAPLARTLGRSGPRQDLKPMLASSWREVRGLFAIAGLLALGLTGWRLATPAGREDHINVPATALAQLPPELRRARVLNDYSFGGSLALMGIPVFIDGRVDMYGTAALQDYIELVDQPNAVRWAEANRRWHFGWTILRPDAALAGFLDRQPGWHRIYADRWAVIHVNDAHSKAVKASAAPAE